MGGIFKTIKDKLFRTKLPYRRMFVVIDLNIENDNSQLHKRLVNADKDADLENRDILQLIKLPAVNNAVYMMQKGDYFIIDDYKILDELRFIDYIEFNEKDFIDDKNSFRILCKNYITEFTKIVFIVDAVMIYNNNVNIIMKLVRPDKLESKVYQEKLEKTETKLVQYEFAKN